MALVLLGTRATILRKPLTQSRTHCMNMPSENLTSSTKLVLICWHPFVSYYHLDY